MHFQRPTASDPPPPPPAIVVFDPFIVNLADRTPSRFLRVTAQLVVESEAQAALLEQDKVRTARVRSSILELLAKQTAEHLLAPEGKAELKAQIAAIVSGVEPTLKVIDVLFAEFIVQ
jgi:flagellar basal body-associated protein FliL